MPPIRALPGFGAGVWAGATMTEVSVDNPKDDPIDDPMDDPVDDPVVVPAFTDAIDAVVVKIVVNKVGAAVVEHDMHEQFGTQVQLSGTLTHACTMG